MNSLEIEKIPPLHQAASEGDTAKVKFLLEQNVNRRSKNLLEHQSAINLLHYSTNKTDKTENYFLGTKSEIDSFDDRKCTPLHYAAKGRNFLLIYTINSVIKARLLFNFWTFGAVFYSSFASFY